MVYLLAILWPWMLARLQHNILGIKTYLQGAFSKNAKMFLGLLPSFFVQSILMFLDCINTLVQHSLYYNTLIIHIQNSSSFWAHGWWTPSFICIERVYGLTVTLAQCHRGVSWTAYQLLELLNAPWELLLPYLASESDFVIFKVVP